MKLWISRIFLYTGLVLLLFHNLAAHHHYDDHHDPKEHHDNEALEHSNEPVDHHDDALEHAQIDHIFSPQVYHFDGLQAIIPAIVYQPEYSFIQFPLTLHMQPMILPDEPYPPGWVTDQTILRGPPLNC